MIEKKLYELLMRVKENINYYSDILEGMNKFSDSKQVLEGMPILTKDELRMNIVDHIDRNIEMNVLKAILDYDKDFRSEYKYESCIGKPQVEYTSGTTGIPFFSIKTDEERIKLGIALWQQRNRFLNLKPIDMCCFMHSGNKKHMEFLNNLSIKEQLYYLEKKRFESWHIYPGKLDEYYEFLLRENRPFNGVQYIECNGAYVSQVERKNYEKVFNCRLLNNYGSREVWNIAYSTVNDLFYINEKSIYFELVDDYNNIITNCNEIGYIVVTSLTLYTMPFIRYKIGDRGYYIDDELGNRGIVIVPERNKIMGTELYGNRIFKEVVLFLNQIYEITNYDGMYICQKNMKTFEVNINGFNGDKQKFEDAFIKCFYLVSSFKRAYKFEFSYNKKKRKSLFSIKQE